MFKITTRDFIKPGSMYYVDITFNGERVPTTGSGLILSSTDGEEYLQDVLGPILQEAFDRGKDAGYDAGMQVGRETAMNAARNALHNL